MCVYVIKQLTAAPCYVFIKYPPIFLITPADFFIIIAIALRYCRRRFVVQSIGVPFVTACLLSKKSRGLVSFLSKRFCRPNINIVVFWWPPPPSSSSHISILVLLLWWLACLPARVALKIKNCVRMLFYNCAMVFSL